MFPVQKMKILSDSNQTRNLQGSNMQLHYFRQIGHYRRDETVPDAIYEILRKILFQLKYFMIFLK